METVLEGFLLNYRYITGNVVMPQYVVSQIKGSRKEEKGIAHCGRMLFTGGLS